MTLSPFWPAGGTGCVIPMSLNTYPEEHRNDSSSTITQKAYTSYLWCISNLYPAEDSVYIVIQSMSTNYLQNQSKTWLSTEKITALFWWCMCRISDFRSRSSITCRNWKTMTRLSNLVLTGQAGSTRSYRNVVYDAFISRFSYNFQKLLLISLYFFLLYCNTKNLHKQVIVWSSAISNLLAVFYIIFLNSRSPLRIAPSTEPPDNLLEILLSCNSIADGLSVAQIYSNHCNGGHSAAYVNYLLINQNHEEILLAARIMRSATQNLRHQISDKDLTVEIIVDWRYACRTANDYNWNSRGNTRYKRSQTVRSWNIGAWWAIICFSLSK